MSNGDQEDLGARAPLQERLCNAGVEASHRANVVVGRVTRRHRLEMPAGKAQHQPGRHRHRDEEREQHRHRSVGRDRAHVGAHQAADKHHRQQRGDDGERGDDGRIADFRDGFDRGLDSPARAAHRPMPDDVLHHDDRVVDENADREDQCEEAYAVDCVAHHPGREQGQQNRRWDDDQHHDALAPADRRRDEDHDRDCRKSQVKQEFVRLLVGGVAVVARHRDLKVSRHDPALDRLQTLHDLLCDDDCVCALALGDCEADGRPTLEEPGGIERHRPGALVDLRRADDDVRDVLDIDRAPVARRQQQKADVWNPLQRLAGDDRNGFAVFAERAGQERPVGVGELVGELTQRDPV